MAGKPIGSINQGFIHSSNSMLIYRENNIGNNTPLVSGVNMNIMQASAIRVFESINNTGLIQNQNEAGPYTGFGEELKEDNNHYPSNIDFNSPCGGLVGMKERPISNVSA
jgi:hypothetical protein